MSNDKRATVLSDEELADGEGKTSKGAAFSEESLYGVNDGARALGLSLDELKLGEPQVGLGCKMLRSLNRASARAKTAAVDEPQERTTNQLGSGF